MPDIRALFFLFFITLGNNSSTTINNSIPRVIDNNTPSIVGDNSFIFNINIINPPINVVSDTINIFNIDFYLSLFD